jgi:hypothetical protein
MAARGKRSISTAELRAECAPLERAVLTERLAEREALARHRPGGAQNPARDARAWLAYYRYLHRCHARGAAGGGGAPALSREQADAVALDALRAQPIPVRRMNALPDDPPLYVYPKSLDALLHVHALDRQLGYMTEQHARVTAALEQQHRAELAELLPRLADAISYAYQLLAWIVTTPGPGMPYGPDDDRPMPPESIRALEPWDVVRICAAHQRHLAQLHAVSVLLDAKRPTEAGARRPSWSAFAAELAAESGTSVETIMKFRSLASELARAMLHADMTAPRAPEAE